MYFKFSLRKHPESRKLSGYYRLVESYRNAENRVCHRTILNVGFMENATPEQLNRIKKQGIPGIRTKNRPLDKRKLDRVRTYRV